MEEPVDEFLKYIATAFALPMAMKSLDLPPPAKIVIKFSLPRYL